MHGICELCGSEGDLKRARVENSTLLVCEKCTRYGEEVSPILPKPEITQRLKLRRDRCKEKNVFEESIAELVPDYASRIKKARLEKGLEPKEVAKLIHEKRTVVLKLESGALTPNESLVRKLERMLGIKLME